MTNRTTNILALAVGLSSIGVFLYCASYYASPDHATRTASTAYSLVACLHLLLPLNVGVSAAVMAASRSRRVLLLVWLCLAAGALLVSTSYVRALIDFDTPSDHRVGARAAGEAISLVTRPTARAVIAGFMATMLIAGAFSRRVVRRRSRVIGAALSGSAALFSFACLVILLMFGVSWPYYGTIHAFCLMAACLIAVPLFMGACNALLMRIEAFAVPLVAWIVVSLSASGLLAIAVAELGRQRDFLRIPASAPSELHGICASMANRPLLGAVSSMVIVLVIVMARAAAGAPSDAQFDDGESPPRPDGA